MTHTHTHTQHSKTTLDERSVRRRHRYVSKAEYSPDSGDPEVKC